MVKSVFMPILLLFFITLQAQNPPEPYYVNYEITNTELKRELQNYIDSVSGYEYTDKALFVTVHIKKNQTKYYISYGFSPDGVGNPIHQIAQIKNMLVIFSIAGFDGGVLKEHVLLKMAKNHFRLKYEYYFENDRWPIPDNIDFVPTLVLTFKNGKLVKKEKTYY